MNFAIRRTSNDSRRAEAPEPGDHTIIPGTLEIPSGFADISDFDDSEQNFDRHVECEVAEEWS